MSNNIKKVLKVGAAKASASLGGPFFQILLLSALPLAAVGQINTLLALVMGMCVIARGGLDILLLREASHDWRSERKGEIYPLIKVFIKKMLYRSVIITVLVIFGLTVFSSEAFSVSFSGLVFVSALSLTLPISMLLSAALKSIDHVVLGAWFEQGQIFFISSALGLIFFKYADNKDFFYLLVSSSSILLLFLLYLNVHSALRDFQESNRKVDGVEYNEVGLFGINFVAYLAQWGVILIFALFYSDEETGAFSSAMRFGMALNFMLMVSNQFVIPKISYYYRTGRRGDLELLIRKMASILFVMGIIVIGCLGLVVYYMDIAGQYAVIVDMTFIIMLGQLINISSGAVGYALALTGNERLFLQASFTGAATGLILMAVFGFYNVPAIFAVVTYSFIPLLTTVLSVFYVKRCLGFYCLPNFRK